VTWKLRHPLRLGLVLFASLGSLTGICYGLLILGVWIPVVPPALAAIATGGAAIVTIAYQMQQQQEKVSQLALEQEQTIEQLTTLLHEGTKTLTTQNWSEEKTRTMTNPDNGAESWVSFPPPSIATPSLDGRYKINRVLGQGGFGQTFLAEDTKRPGHPTCVVKYLMPARQDAKFLNVARRLFETEAKILEALGQHSQIPQLLAYFEQNQQFYLVEQYIEGEPLSEELKADTRLSEVQVVEILEDVLEVLAFIHKHHVIHRDIKPSNIIRSKEDGLLVLIDFGAVKQMQETEDQTIAIGTRGYAPPEQFHGRPRPNSDIYALGMIGIQALTGISPQQLIEERDQKTDTLIWRHLANVGDELARVLNKMVEYHGSDRYQSATEALEDLNRIDPAKLSDRVEDLRKLPTDSDLDTLHLSDTVDDATIKVDHEQ
jgi:serine/threonine protein kinase